MPKLNRSAVLDKPRKPHPDFPLFPHATGRWAKKVRGKLHYFGGWDDPNAALQKWLDQKDDLIAGRTPRRGGGLTVRDLANHFLTAKRHLLDTGELSQRSFADYHGTCERVIKQFGLNRIVEGIMPNDFDSLRASIGKTRGPVALGNEVQRIRTLFKYAYDANLIDKPVRFGPNFKRPTRRALQQARNAKGLRMYDAEQVRSLLNVAGRQLKAMILLGVNCGFGNSDVGTLPVSALDLNQGWVDYPRPKTGIHRRCPLWPETVTAIQAASKVRYQHKREDHSELIFVTKRGYSWAKIDRPDNPLSKEMTKLLKKLGFDRPGLNFYALRHTFATIGGEAKDQVAVDHIMGHAPAGNDMAAVYRERISDERLIAVTEHVRKWLFGETESKRDGMKPKRSRRPK
jgi:integrase